MSSSAADDLTFTKIDDLLSIPGWISRNELAVFFHETMKPYNDTLADVQSALDYALVPGRGQGGFLMLVHRGEKLLGALLMLETGMSGYVPEHILLFVSVLPETRGQGVGGELIRRAVAECDGDVKLHVEYENPAKRLYERIGFESRYAEMRLPGGKKEASS